MNSETDFTLNLYNRYLRLNTSVFSLRNRFQVLLLVGLCDSSLDATDGESPGGLSRLSSDQNDLGVAALIRTVVAKGQRILTQFC